MTQHTATRAYLGLGSNLGDRQATLEAAITRLGNRDTVAVTARSRFLRTEPWGKTDQPWFLNAVIAIETTLAPRDLLAACQQVERELGRVRKEKWGPRTLDIDILLYGEETIDEPGLTIPHPHLTERAFVLEPMAELAPDEVVSGKSVRAHLDALLSR